MGENRQREGWRKGERETPGGAYLAETREVEESVIKSQIGCLLAKWLLSIAGGLLVC